MENSKKKAIFVYMCDSYPYALVGMMPFVKQLAKKYKRKIVIGYNFGVLDDGLRAMYDSYGVDAYRRVDCIPFWWQLYFLFLALKMWFMRKNGMDIVNISYHGVPFGDDIYDALIRNNEGTYTIRRVKLKYTKFIARTYFSMYCAEKLFSDRNRYDMLVFTDCDYERCGYPKMAMKYGLKIWQASGTRNTEHREKEGYKLIHRLTITKEMYDTVNAKINKSMIDSFLKSHFNGMNTNYLDRVAYAGKKLYKKEDLYKVLGVIGLNRRNILVAAHAFSDTPHYGRHMIYQDYYCWLVGTVKLLAQNPNVNVFVKEHPTSYMYKEKGSVKYHIDKYKLSNVYVLPADFSTKSVFSLMDAVVTCQGTIGLEATIFGLPVFTASQGYYYGFGIDINSDTIEKYEERMRSITEYPKPTEEQREKAKVLLYIAMQVNNFKYTEDMTDDDIRRYPWSSKDAKQRQCESIIRYLKQGVDPRGKYYNQLLQEVCILHD